MLERFRFKPFGCRPHLLQFVRRMAPGDLVYVRGGFKSPSSIQLLRRWKKATGFSFEWAACLNGGFVLRRAEELKKETADG
jgi:hypothetical protein